MKLRKVTLIEPKAPGYHVYVRTPIPRLGLPILGAILKNRGIDVKVFHQETGPIDYGVVRESDLVGISTTTSTAPEAYRIADRVNSYGIPVVMGGSHVSFMADEALEHADYCVRGEGEETLVELVEALESGSEPAGIDGISYRRGNEKIHNPSRGYVEDLDSLPFPDLSLIQGYNADGIIPIATSRGCPFDCSFCSVTKMFGRKYRTRSIENVIEELRDKKPNKVFFCDDNFAANPDRTKRLLETMLSTNTAPPWTAQVRCDVTRDRELLKLMRESNCYYVYIGFESVSQAALDEFNKRQSVEEIVESIRLLHEHGIMIHGMFIIGAESDTRQTIRDTVSFALKHGIDTVQLMSLTPLPGTPCFTKMENEDRLLTRDWSLYDGHHVVFKPAGMSAYEMQRDVILAMKRFYSIYECFRLLVRPDFLVFVWNVLIGRWRDARSRARMKFVGWFYRVVGHHLVNQFAAANKSYFDKIRKMVGDSYERAKPKKPTAEGMD
jgi:radical SAM superfamily enzyme YgiQ (UPF0313 family)